MNRGTNPSSSTPRAAAGTPSAQQKRIGRSRRGAVRRRFIVASGKRKCDVETGGGVSASRVILDASASGLFPLPELVAESRPEPRSAPDGESTDDAIPGLGRCPESRSAHGSIPLVRASDPCWIIDEPPCQRARLASLMPPGSDRAITAIVPAPTQAEPDASWRIGPMNRIDRSGTASPRSSSSWRVRAGCCCDSPGDARGRIAARGGGEGGRVLRDPDPAGPGRAVPGVPRRRQAVVRPPARLAGGDPRRGAARGARRPTSTTPPGARCCWPSGTRSPSRCPPTAKLPDEARRRPRPLGRDGHALARRGDDPHARARSPTPRRPTGPSSPSREPRPPAVSDPSWVATPIDAFILARLDADGSAPSPAGRSPDPDPPRHAST